MSASIPLWRKIQKTNFTRIHDLIAFLELSQDQAACLAQKPRFSLNLPLRLAQKIEKGNLQDPILRQFIPLQEEALSSFGFSCDPVGDLSARKSDRLLQKYHGRALLLTTSACAVHCRYCFRQNFPYEKSPSDFSKELSAIRSDPSLTEVILSGGDPLSLSNEVLRSLFSSLASCTHLTRIRIHTRFPIGIPERIDEELLSLFASHPQQIFFVIHTNHPRELDEQVMQHLKKVQKLGIPLLNQSVLLKGVNDEEAALLALCEKLIDSGILPYYLHLLDRVAGSAHFEVSLERGRQLVSHLQQQLSGYGVPKLAREETGMPSKTTFFNFDPPAKTEAGL